jgi:TonB family protein
MQFSRKHCHSICGVALILPLSFLAAQNHPEPAPKLTSLKLCSEKGSDQNTCLQKLPRAKHSPKPRYTKKAERENIQGIVLVQAIVGTDGHPQDVAVVRSLGYGLDEKAVEAVKKWRFQPAIGRDGKPVAVPVTIEIAFNGTIPESR